ncbi:MAG: hypothetical protein R3C28_23800 [Pirellulaceae bacterium]
MAIEPEDDFLHGGLRAPRFTLRSLFVVIFLICLVTAALSRMTPSVAMVALTTLLAMGAHVFANVVGMQLKKNSQLAKRRERPVHAIPPSQHRFAQRTELGERNSLGKPLLVATAVGAMLGAIVATAMSWQTYSDKIGPAGLALGALSGLLLGGFWGFWTWSLLHVAFSAWWNAQQERRHQE